MKRTILTSIAVTIAVIGSFAQNIPTFVTDSLDNYIQQAMQSWKIPGVAVCIVKDGQVIYEKGLGVIEWGKKENVNEQTRFPIASITKTFTGTAMAMLEAEGKVSLEDPLARWLPSFKMKDKRYEEQITLTDILSHRSGWKTFQGDLLNTESSLDKSTMFEKFGQMQPAYPIRTRFGYSNFGFMLAGEVFKTISGDDWAHFVKKSILDPLNMQRTIIYPDQLATATNITSKHTVKNDTIVVLKPDKVEIESHGGIYSTVHDLGIWMNTLLNKGVCNGENIIPEKAITKMWTSHTIIGKGRAADRKFYLKTYGLGWEIMQYNGFEIIQHGGAYSGVLTMMGMVPSLNLGIVVLTNSDDHNLQEVLKWQVIDAFIEKQAPNYVRSITEYQKKKKAEQTSATKEVKTVQSEEPMDVPADQLTGTYLCEAYGKGIIKKRGNNYILTLEYHPQLEGVLTHLNKNQMTCAYNHPMFGKTILPFNIENKKVKGFTLFVDPFVEADGYEFRKIE
jgi:CubicO group peptidase (beta-lactamase class C family)